MEKIQGVDLEEFMRQRRFQPIDQKKAIEWLAQLADILREIHNQQFFHRDIKPSNIILKSDGQLVLIDFGAARQVTATIIGGRQSTGIYTPGYAPPEQERGHAVPQSDFFALGRTFVNLLTGKEPSDLSLYNPQTNRLEWQNFAPQVSSAFVEFLDQLMARSIDQRPPTPQTIGQELTRIQHILYPDVPHTALMPDPSQSVPRSSGSTPVGATPNYPQVNYPQGHYPPPPAYPQSPAQYLYQPQPPPPEQISGHSTRRSKSRRWFIGAATAISVVAGGYLLRSAVTHFLRRTDLAPPVANSPSPDRPVAPLSPSASPPTTLTVAQAGQGDYRTIRDAIQNAQPGTRIQIRPGIYQESVIIDRFVELIGEGSRETIIIQNTTASCISMQTDRAVVSGLTIRGQAGEKPYYAVDIPQGALLLADCDITSNALACIGVYGSMTNPVIQRCAIHTSNQVGVLFYENAQGTIKDCDVYGNALAGVEIREGANPIVQGCKIYDGRASGLFIHTNAQGTIEGCDIYGNVFAGMEVKAGGNPTVRNSNFYNGKEGGVLIQENGSGLYENCQFYGNTLGGIEIRATSNPTIQQCKIHNGLNAGIFIHQTSQGTIDRCEIYGNTLGGILSQGNSNPIIRNSTIYNGKQGGIFFSENSQGKAENCEIYGNALAGIEIRHPGTNPVIQQCTIHDGIEGGVLVHENAQGLIENCDITANTLSGVEIRNGGNPTVRQCRITDNQTFGVYAHSNAQGKIENCTITGNVSGSTSVENSQTQIVGSTT